MSAPTPEGRLLCVCNCTYAINSSGTLPTDLYYNGAGFLKPPQTFLNGTNGIDACLVGATDDGIVLAFRGTLPLDVHDYDSLRDWMQDFEGKPVAVPWLPTGSGFAHEGFLASLEPLWPQALGAVSKLLAAAGSTARLLITGHSKGGAAAPLAALRLSVTANLPSQVVTFAAPHVGDRAFADTYNNSLIVHTRYENTDDLAPHLPPSLGGFLEVLEEFAPGAAQQLAGVGRYDYEPLGALRFIDWDGQIVSDSATLETRRSLRLAARLLSNHWEFIRDDHSIACGQGYMTIVCPTGVCP